MPHPCRRPLIIRKTALILVRVEYISIMRVAVESISAMQVFVQAAEKHSFKLAGQVVGLTPSAVGKAIQKLEDQLSVRLFHRSTRSVTITPEGQLFLERCRRILAEVEAAQAEVAQASAAPRGRLKIGIPAEPMLLLPAIADFNEAYPDIELELDIDDRFVDVIDEGFDAVIRSGEPKDSRLRYRRLGDFGWRFVASPAYLDQAGTLNLLWPASRYPLSKVRVFVDFITRRLGQEFQAIPSALENRARP